MSKTVCIILSIVLFSGCDDIQTKSNTLTISIPFNSREERLTNGKDVVKFFRDHGYSINDVEYCESHKYVRYTGIKSNKIILKNKNNENKRN